MILRRPRQERIARWVLAAALYIPVGSLIDYAGVSALTTGIAAAAVILSVALVVNSLHPVVVVSESGLVVRNFRTRTEELINWDDIGRVELRTDRIEIHRRWEAPVCVRLDRKDGERLSRVIAAHRSPPWLAQQPAASALSERE